METDKLADHVKQALGMEIVAPPHHEPELIRLGYACEQLLKRRRPSEFVPAL